MRLPRVFIDEVLNPLAPAKDVEIAAKATHHLKNVLRLKAGSQIEIIDGAKEVYSASLKSFQKNKMALVTIADSKSLGLTALAENQLETWLFQAPPKGKRLDAAIRPLSELGTSHFTPLICERSVTGRDKGEDSWMKRAARWQRLAAESAKQCGRRTPLEITAPENFAAVINRLAEFQVGLLLTPEKGAVLKTATQKALGHLKIEVSRHKRPFTCAFLIGPEGGFSPDEEKAATLAGWQPFCINPLILRSENAGPAAMAILQFMILYGL